MTGDGLDQSVQDQLDQLRASNYTARVHNAAGRKEYIETPGDVKPKPQNIFATGARQLASPIL